MRLCDSLLNSWNTTESVEIELVATLPGYPQSVNGKFSEKEELATI